MSGHAETIRDVLLQPINGEYSRELAVRSLDALLAENQRLRDALERIDAYIASLAYPGPEAKRIAEAVREALAGDTE